MKNYILRAAKKLAGVRMLRCAMLLALLVVTVLEVRAQKIVIWENGIDVNARITLYCYSCRADTQHKVTQIITYPCTQDGMLEAMCVPCGAKKEYHINRIGSHDWREWKGDDTPATCTTPSGRYHVCYRCGTTEYEQPALGHNMSGWTTVAVTCTTDGYEHSHCQRSGCNYEETRNQTPALGHNFALDHNCTRCDAVDPAQKPEGYIDHCAGGALQFSISGWAYDANVPATSIDIHVYVYQNDGTTRYGDIHIIHADLERPDLATARGIPTNHGYSATIPIADPGTYKVKAYAIDLNGDGNPQIGATQTITVGVPYIDANGQAQNCNSATRLTGGGNFPKLPAGWYYVTGEVNYTSLLTLQGDANIILCDGATLNIGSNDTRLTHCIKGGGYTLTIYGQSKQTGTLNAYSRNAENVYVANFNMMGGNINLDCISNYNAALLLGTEGTGTLTQKRGNLNVTTTAKQGVIRGNVDFRGGQLAANGGYGIKGTVNISWSNPDDRFRTSSFGKNDDKTAIIASGKAFTDGTNYYTGTLNSSEKGSLHDISLWPVTAISLSDIASNSTAVTKLNGVTNLDVTLSDRTLYQDGDWNTLCLPFNINDLTGTIFEDATLMTLDADAGAYEHITGLDNGTLYLNFKDAQSITAGTPYIVKWDNAGTTIEEPEFKGVTLSKTTNNVTSNDGKVTFVGYYDLFNIDTPANDDIYYLTTDNQLMHTGKARTLHPMRAYFQLSDGAGVKAFKLSFGDETTHIGVISTFRHDEMSKGAWYDLSGRRFTTRPTRRGFYIHQNKKIAIH